MHGVEIDPMFSVFEDDRRYQPFGPLHPLGLTDKVMKDFAQVYSPKKYKIDDDLTVWFDSVNDRVATTESDFFLQIVMSGDMGRIQNRIFANVGVRRVQFSLSSQNSEGTTVRDSDGKSVWTIEDIGRPLYFNTVFEDVRRNINRPHHERRQVLTNFSHFETSSDLINSIRLLMVSFDVFGNLFSSRPRFGYEKQGKNIAILSDDLKERISQGQFVDS